VTDHLLALIYGLLAAAATAVIAAIATRVRLLPEVIDISIIPTIAGTASIAFTTYGAMRRFDPDRIARLSLLGTVVGTIGGTGGLLIAVLIDVL
jgi:hypothetical protein